MTQTLIEARSLAKSFGSVKAVDCVSLRVERGSIVGLLGVNGAGKTTLMRLLSGALRPDSGNSSIAGFNVQKEPRSALANLGYLPESTGGFSKLTVREFLTFAAQGRGIYGSAVAAAISVAARQLDLGPALDSVMDTLSKGWRQRAWLAQAIVHDPPALVLDEPTDGLDPAQKSELRAFLRTAARTKAILISTHILEEAESLCDRIVFIAEGRAAVDAPLLELCTPDGRLKNAFDRLSATSP
jgi:ABC-2 type transport system ATP-binding protein